MKRKIIGYLIVMLTILLIVFIKPLDIYQLQFLKSSKFLWFENIHLHYLTILILFVCSLFFLKGKGIVKFNNNTKKVKNTDDFHNLYCDNLPLLICSIDEKCLIKSVSNQWLNKMGYLIDEVLEHKVRKFISTNSKNQIEEFIKPELFVKSKISNVSLVLLTKQRAEINTICSICTTSKDSNNSFYQVIMIDISEQIKAEYQLKKKTQYLKSILKVAPTGIGVIRNEILVDVNNKICNMIGYEKNELYGKNPSIFYSSNKEYVAVKERVDDQIDMLGSSCLETKWKCKDGYIISVILSSTPITLDNLENGIIFTALDNTDKNIADRKLRESENKLSSLFNSLPGMAYQCKNDNEWTMEFVSNGCFGLTGYNSSELLNNKNISFNKLIYFPDRIEVKEQISCAIFFGNTYGVIYRIVTKNNSIKWVIDRGVKNLDNNSLEGILIDITYYKTAELLLKENNNRLRSLTESATDSIVSVNSVGNIISWNSSSELLFGYKSNEIIDKHLSEIMHVKDIDKLFSCNQGNLNKIGTFEIQCIKKDRKIFPIELSISSWESKGEKYYTGIIRDVTQRKENEEKINNYRLHLEELVNIRTKELQDEIIKRKSAEKRVIKSLIKEKELNELKSRFISVASHEFKTPLTTIYSSTEILQRYGQTMKLNEFSTHTNMIICAVEYLNEMISDVLILSRSETGKLIFNPEEFSLNEFINPIINNINITLKEKQKIIYCNEIANKHYCLDKKLVKVILNNLLTNAIKYSKNNVTLKIFEKNKYLFIIVDDQGIGISNQELNSIFLAFHRAANVGLIQGTGLGLTIVKKAVELHSGEIFVNSQEGVGSKFTVKIPHFTN